MHSFKLKKSAIVFISTPAILISLFNMWSFYGRISRSEPLGWQDAMYIVACCVLLYCWLTIPVEIQVLSEGTIKFNAPIKRTMVSVSDIKFIKRAAMSPGFLRIRHARGRITVMDEFYGENDLLTTLKSLNSEIDVEGRAWL